MEGITNIFSILILNKSMPSNSTYW